MGPLNYSSRSKHVAISVIVLYAFFFQGFFSAAVQAAAFDSLDFICSQADNSPDAPGSDPNHHQGLCCILACAASGCAYLDADSDPLVFTDRVGSPIAWPPTQTFATRRASKFYFGARAPPPSV
jgi:hypothetical protein